MSHVAVLYQSGGANGMLSSHWGYKLSATSLNCKQQIEGMQYHSVVFYSGSSLGDHFYPFLKYIIGIKEETCDLIIDRGWRDLSVLTG